MRWLIGIGIVAALACSECNGAADFGMEADAAAPFDASIPTNDLGILADLASSDLARPIVTGFCALPGSVQFFSDGKNVVAGAPAGSADLSFLSLPPGFCAHGYARVNANRQLRFAPSGELFVASPTRATAGGAENGLSAIVVLPDDDHDGYADATLNFLGNLPATQGLLFAGSYLYFQDATRVMRVPYKAGDRAPSAASEQVADISVYTATLHWPKAIDQADDGTIYVTNGDDEPNYCVANQAFRGGILKLDGKGGTVQVVRGLRNPVALRCPKGAKHCYALELARDNSEPNGGREKLIPVHEGDDWAYPCCAARNLPYSDLRPVPDCSAVPDDLDTFLVGDTPFGIDFETGRWPMPWRGSALVALHGSFGIWKGARVVAIGVDPNTGIPRAGSDDTGTMAGAMSDFATGWDDFTLKHGRPAAATFAVDGRLFLGNDWNGDIIWIASF